MIDTLLHTALDWPLLLLTLLTFLLAGMVKGVIGMGLPTVAVGLVVLFHDLHTALVLFLAPTFVTNIWQALRGGFARWLLRRLWLFYLLVFAMVFVGAQALVQFNMGLLTIILGGSLAFYALLSLRGLHLSISKHHEWWAGPVLGGINGISIGMTGALAVPGIMFLQSIGLKRDQLVQALGILFATSTLALSLALSNLKFLDEQLGLYSLLAIVPALIGMELGAKIRQGLEEANFRRIFFIANLGLGMLILIRGMVSLI